MERATGRTTRLADKCIQELFITGSVICHDHHGTREASKRLFEIVKNRLLNEHNGRYLFDNKMLLLNHDRLSFKLINEYKKSED